LSSSDQLIIMPRIGDLQMLMMKKIFFGEHAEHGKIIFSRFAGGNAMLPFGSDGLRFSLVSTF